MRAGRQRVRAAWAAMAGGEQRGAPGGPERVALKKEIGLVSACAIIIGKGPHRRPGPRRAARPAAARPRAALAARRGATGVRDRPARGSGGARHRGQVCRDRQGYRTVLHLGQR